MLPAIQTALALELLDDRCVLSGFGTWLHDSLTSLPVTLPPALPAVAPIVSTLDSVATPVVAPVVQTLDGVVTPVVAPVVPTVAAVTAPVIAPVVQTLDAVAAPVVTEVSPIVAAPVAPASPVTSVVAPSLGSDAGANPGAEPTVPTTVAPVVLTSQVASVPSASHADSGGRNSTAAALPTAEVVDDLSATTVANHRVTSDVGVLSQTEAALLAPPAMPMIAANGLPMATAFAATDVTPPIDLGAPAAIRAELAGSTPEVAFDALPLRTTASSGSAAEITPDVDEPPLPLPVRLRKFLPALAAPVARWTPDGWGEALGVSRPAVEGQVETEPEERSAAWVGVLAAGLAAFEARRRAGTPAAAFDAAYPEAV